MFCGASNHGDSVTDRLIGDRVRSVDVRSRPGFRDRPLHVHVVPVHRGSNHKEALARKIPHQCPPLCPPQRGPHRKEAFTTETGNVFDLGFVIDYSDKDLYSTFWRKLLRSAADFYPVKKNSVHVIVERVRKCRICERLLPCSTQPGAKPNFRNGG